MRNSKLRVSCLAHPTAAKRLRHALAAFLSVLEIEPEVTEDILMATGEALANAIEHAYDGVTPGIVTLAAAFDEELRLVLDVSDTGQFIERDERPGRGFGLRIIRSIASSVDISKDAGTSIHMIFDLQ